MTSTKNRKKVKNKTIKKKDKYLGEGLYPPIKPLKNYKMKVSDLHTIAYSTYGNKNGKPVLFVHGGPGSGTQPSNARFFNPKKYYIVLVDQRGSGKSKPTAEIRENKPDDLIEDFEKIRKNLGIEKWQVFGGSWGSTLSLAYSIKHPDKVTELIVRGIFFCTKPEVDWITEPGGAQKFNPEAWEFYENSIPHKEKFKNNYMKAFEKCFKGDYGSKKKDMCALAWETWEDANSQLEPKKLSVLIKEMKESKVYIPMAAIEHHYFSNECFFKDNYFLDKKNLDKIRHIPTTIVQGLYDMECPFITAYKLHKALPHAKFYPTIAGHTAMDKENIKYLVKATNSYI
jgi:proline iminopeptidase